MGESLANAIPPHLFDKAAARLRVRGYPGRDAHDEWRMMADADRRFWRNELHWVLTGRRP